MRLTQAILKEFLDAEQVIKKLETRKDDIRRAILDQGNPEIAMGEFLVTIKKFTRKVPAHTQSGKRVQVKKVASLIKAAVMAFAVLSCLCTTGCSTARTKWTDPTMRVLIDPDSISADHYVRIQQALVASGKWVVVDRGAGYKAMALEQERAHRDHIDRFEDKEKWARWGHMYSVGGIVVAHAQCQRETHWLVKSRYQLCHQYLAIMSATTGEVIATAEDSNSSDLNEESIAPSWEDVVAKLNNAYPEKYEPNKDHKILDDYRDLSKEEAIRQRESRDPAGKKE